VLGISYHTLNAYLRFRAKERPQPLLPQQSARTAAEVVTAPSEVGVV
jgi:hypothetical protein